jgi:hypothetical protein
MSRQLAKHWITADEFEQMGKASIFHPDTRLELLEGIKEGSNYDN